ncbi:MAG: hypothetical protein RBT34_04925 [Anaerolineaceae bacterium]|nr:hypothetical protein [Anaerolineaceae bacterium]
MPNHIHAIIRIKPIDAPTGVARRGVLQNARRMGYAVNGSLPTAPTTDGTIKSKPLGRLVGAYKTHTTVEINKLLNTPGVKFWQRNYYERIIRNESEYLAVWAYIENNPINWTEDADYFEGDVQA